MKVLNGFEPYMRAIAYLVDETRGVQIVREDNNYIIIESTEDRGQLRISVHSPRDWEAEHYALDEDDPTSFDHRESWDNTDNVIIPELIMKLANCTL